MIRFTLFFSLFLTFQAHAQLPHMDLEMTSREYQALLKKQVVLRTAPQDALRDILKVGQKNLDWLDLINKNRAQDRQLELSTPETQVGIPITQANESSRSIVLNKYNDLLAVMPQTMKDVLLTTKPLTVNPPVSEEIYLDMARKMDRVYQNASRWLLQEPYLYMYSSRATQDIRGYYFLKNNPDTQSQLSNWSAQTEATKIQMREWLIGQCRNSNNSFSSCQSELTQFESKTNILGFYQKYLPRAEKTFAGFFNIQNPRREVYWNQDRTVIFQPFQTPQDILVQNWFQSNVEDEWKNSVFQLKIEYKGTRGIPKLEFEAGATPHVNGLGGDTITMDANRNIEEYSSRWTIRHEYGHVLGFPDCYIEFYDSQKQVMINYQIDIENLMCSRRGHLQPKHVDELIKAYKNN